MDNPTNNRDPEEKDHLDEQIRKLIVLRQIQQEALSKIKASVEKKNEALTALGDKQKLSKRPKR